MNLSYIATGNNLFSGRHYRRSNLILTQPNSRLPTESEKDTAVASFCVPYVMPWYISSLMNTMPCFLHTSQSSRS